MIILIDQDGVLADYEGGFLKKWRENFPNELFIPLESRDTFLVSDGYPEELREKVKSIYSAPGFYRNLPLVSGAVEAVEQLIKSGHDIMICTSTMNHYENCVLEKYQWIEQYFGRNFIQRVILTGDKTLARGDLLIDDKPEIDGILEPEWEHVLFNAPYNRNVIGKKRIDWGNWREVLTI